MFYGNSRIYLGRYHIPDALNERDDGIAFLRAMRPDIRAKMTKLYTTVRVGDLEEIRQLLWALIEAEGDVQLEVAARKERSIVWQPRPLSRAALPIVPALKTNHLLYRVSFT